MIKNLHGIVLTSMRYRESGKILRVFTRERGLLSVMAQGVYKKNSSLLAVTETFAESDWDLEAGRQMYYLRGTELIDLHYLLRQSIEWLHAAQKGASYIIRAIPEEVPQVEVFDLYRELLTRLPEGKDPASLQCAFMLQLVRNLGSAPYLHACTHCGNRKIKTMRFSLPLQGILCEKCHLIDRQSQPFSKDDYFQVYSLLNKSLKEISLQGSQTTSERVRFLVEEYVKNTIDLR